MITEQEILDSAEKSSQFTYFLTTVYKNHKWIADYNKFRSPKDYMDYYYEKVCAVDQPIGLIYTDEDFYLVVINVENYTIVIGPGSERDPKSEQIEKLAAMMELSDTQKEALLQANTKVTLMPISTAIILACADYHVLTGIRLNPTDILRDNTGESNTLSDESAKRWKSLCELDETMAMNEAIYQFEKNMIHAIMTGREEEVDNVFRAVPGILYKYATSHLKHVQNAIVIAATLASRAAIYCGVSPAETLSMAEYYVYKSEHIESLDALAETVVTMLKGFARSINNINQVSEASDFVKTIDGYIESRLSEKMTIEEMASDLGVSRNTLSGRFKKETGYVLSEHIMLKRIARAKYLMSTTDLSLSEISHYLCFSSQSHFQSVFKKYTSMTPLEYRNKYRY